jgi:hypothetical protein
MKDRRTTKWPYWYYGMIVVTAASTTAGVYFRGTKVQGDIQIDRIIMGAVVTAFFALATYSFKQLIKEVRTIGKRMGQFTLAMLQLEMQLHPDKAKEVMEAFRDVVRDKENGEFGD